MNAYIDTIKVTDENGEKSILYPRTKQNAVEGLAERLAKLEVADITETEDTTLENSNAGRLLFTEIDGAMEQGANPSPTTPQEIKNVSISGIKTHGKNLFDVSKLVQGSLNSGTGIEENNTQMKRTDFISCTPSSNYTISGIANGVCVFFFDSNKAFISTSVFEATTVIETFVTPSNCAYIRMHGINANWTDVVMLNEGTEATEYEPYTESSITFSQPIDIYGMDDVRDILTSKQIKRKYAKFVFDGTEDVITLSTTTTGGGYYFRIPLSGIKPNINGNSKANALCTRLTQYTPNYLWENDVDGFSIDTQTPDTQRIRFRLTSLTDVVSVDALKAKLAEWYAEGKPLTFVLELATETTEELPIADQIALNSLQTFDGITHVEFVGDVQPTFKAEYGTSKVGGMTLESLLTARSNDLRLSAVESAVVNNI